MAVASKDFTWEQGEDLEIAIIYKTGTSEANATPKDLTGYSVRMDIRATDVSGNRIYTFNSEDVIDLDGAGPNSDDDVVKEISQPGADGMIRITVPRSLTVQGGPIFELMSDTLNPVNIFAYDIFLRDTDDKQAKILAGKIIVNRSVTLWT
jgi:hypothetical protein